MNQPGFQTSNEIDSSTDFFVGTPSAGSTGSAISDRPDAAYLDQTFDRIESTLLDLEQLLAEDSEYVVPELPYELPTDFRLSIVIPVYNERDTIRRLLVRVHSLPIPHEIVIVDDHSTDGTVEILKEFETIPEVRVICKPQNEGKGAALRTGFEQVTGDIVVVQDADLEYDPRDLLRLLPPLLNNEVDVVYGSRFLEDTSVNSSWLHQAGNRWLTTASNLTTGLKITDMETCYKLVRRELLQSISLKQDRFGFEPEITAKLARRGARIRELPIGYEARTWEEGKKIGIKDGLNALYCIARYAFRD